MPPGGRAGGRPTVDSSLSAGQVVRANPPAPTSPKSTDSSGWLSSIALSVNFGFSRAACSAPGQGRGAAGGPGGHRIRGLADPVDMTEVGDVYPCWPAGRLAMAADSGPRTHRRPRPAERGAGAPLSDEQAVARAREIYQTINQVALVRNIRPTIPRATIVLRKVADHRVRLRSRGCRAVRLPHRTQFPPSLTANPTRG